MSHARKYAHAHTHMRAHTRIHTHTVNIHTCIPYDRKSKCNLRVVKDVFIVVAVVVVAAVAVVVVFLELCPASNTTFKTLFP